MGVLRYEDADLAKLLLRLMVGGLMLFHGVNKLFHGVSFIEGLMTGAGLPAFFAYGVYVGEVIAPLMLLLGYRVKIASLLLMASMFVAICLVHSGDLFTLNEHGAWGVELQMFYILGAAAIFLLGEGKYSLDARK